MSRTPNCFLFGPNSATYELHLCHAPSTHAKSEVEGYYEVPNGTVPNGHDRAAGPDATDRAAHRAAVNKANAQKSTGPRTPDGSHL